MLSNVLFLTVMLFSGETLAFSGWSAFSRNKQLNGLYQFRSNFEVKQFRNGIHLNALTPPDPDEKYIKLNALRNAINSFVGFLWKGLTFPFPILRGLANESTDTGFTLVECLLAVTSYLGTGVLAYSVVFEKWSIVDALYFSVVSFTTVGYGDICPTTPASKMFSCVYGLAGVVILGAAISSIGTRLINAEVEAIQVAERASRRSLLNVFDALPRLLTNNSTQPIKFKNEPEKMEIEKQVSVPIWRQLLMKATKTVVPAFSVLFMGGLLMGRLEGWQWPDSLYYSLITAGTLGFGDFSPHTKAGRLWAVAYIPLAVAVAGEVLGSIASILVERRQKEAHDRILHRELTTDYLLQLDSNGDGTVSREEFIQGMLVELKLVNVEQLKELNEQFDRLDVAKSGALDKEDLKLAAQLRGATQFSEKR